MAGSPPKFPPPPPPFPSHPSAAELIESYLRPRVASGGKVKAGEFIHDADLYDADPGDLTGRFRPVTAGDGREAWYFFTKRKYRSVFKVAVDRAVGAGEGRWEQEGPPQPVLSNLGGRPRQQSFAFMRKEGAREVRSGWSMVELCLDPSDEFVMCKVYRSLSDDPEAIDAAAEAEPRFEIREAGDNDPGAETAAGLRLEIREAGDKDPGAETAAASPERQKKAVVGEGAGAATTWRGPPLDAAERGKAPANPEDEVEAPAPAVHAMDSFPSEAELINSYLRPWVATGENAGEFIHKADVYADAPDDLARLFTPVAAADRGGEEAWYFLTKLRLMGMNVTRRVDSGKGTWRQSKQLRPVLSDDGSSIGQSQTFTFTRKEAKKQLHLGWMMVELRLNGSDPNALCKVYRSPWAPGSKEADDEASSAVGVAAHGREDGEEVDSAAAAEAAAVGPGLKRKADDEASSAVGLATHGREEDGEEIDSAAAAADAAEEVEAPAEPEEPNDPSKPKLHKFF